MTYEKIEKWAGQRDWPFKRMNAGDSETFPPDIHKRPQRAAFRYGRSSGKKFKTKTTADGSIKITRIE